MSILDAVSFMLLDKKQKVRERERENLAANILLASFLAKLAARRKGLSKFGWR